MIQTSPRSSCFRQRMACAGGIDRAYSRVLLRCAPSMMGEASASLAVGICTCDTMRTIEATVRTARELADHVLVLDSGSSDGTVELCRELGAEVRHEAWRGYGQQKTLLLESLAGFGWVLVLDSDEAVSPELAAIRPFERAL